MRTCDICGLGLTSRAHRPHTVAVALDGGAGPSAILCLEHYEEIRALVEGSFQLAEQAWSKRVAARLELVGQQ